VEGGTSMEILGGAAVVLVLFWLRGRFYRSRFKRALKAMERGGAAQRAGRLFWMLLVLVVLVAVVQAYVEAHAR
jgi:hypothetical protein